MADAPGFSRGRGSANTSIQDVLKLQDPLLSFKWVCTSLPYKHKVEYVESIDLPFLNIGIGDKTHVASGYYYYPSTHDISSFSMTIYEDSSASTLKWLLYWKNQVKDFSTGLYNLPGTNDNGYKQTIKVALLDTANNQILTASLLGVWPADTGNLGLNYTDVNGRIAISQTFSVDDQKLEFNF